MPGRPAAYFLLVFVLTAFPAFSRPYHGEVFTFTQPDKTPFQVRLYGDEYYVVIETLDGYTLTRDPETGFYSYALPSPDGMSFIPSGYAPGEVSPSVLHLRKHERLDPRAVKQLSEAAQKMFGVDSRGRLLPSLRLRLRPGDFGFDRWTQSLDAEALTLESGPKVVPLSPPGNTTVGTRVALVMLARFPDRPGDVLISQAEVDAYVNDPDYTGFGNATSVFGYFDIQSDGRLRYNSIVTAYFTAAQPRDYYTDSTQPYGTRARELIKEGLAVLKADGFDFTKADGNDDSVLDGVNIFYVGDRVNNWAEGLWPHKSSLYWDGLSGEGVSPLFQYQITNMGARLELGAFVHENGHMICNLPDLYPYDGSAADLGGYSLMHSSGSIHPPALDAYLKIHAGWATVIDIDAASHLRGSVQVDLNTFYRYRNPARSEEYFLLSMRRGAGYEGPYGGDASAVNPTDGLVIWHALETGTNKYSSITTADNPFADYSVPYELMVVEANPGSVLTPWYDEPQPGINDGYHAGDVDEAFDSTMPALKFWSNSGRTEVSGMHIHSVSARGDAMTFVVGAGAPVGSPTIGSTAADLAPACDFGANAASQTFGVFNSGGGALNYSLSDNTSWMSVSPSSGTTTTEADQITVTYSSDGLAPGTYNGTITITDPGAWNSPVDIPVTLTVSQQSAISLSTTTLTESLAAGATAAGFFVIANSGGGTLHYTLAESASWLSLEATSGTVSSEEDRIAVSYDTAGLFDGVYGTTITVTADNAVNSPRVINVTLVVSGHIAVIDPDGGETLWQGNGHDIRWLTDGSVTGDVKIELFKGGVFDSLITGSTANDGLYDWSIDGGQPIGPDYRVRISSVNEPGISGESIGDFSVASLPVLDIVPYTESFESGFGIWSQSSGDSIDWRRIAGSTPSIDTGPAGAQLGNFYIYTEASYESETAYNGSPDKVAVLDGYFDLRYTTAPILSFYYHMYGAAIGTLLVEASPDQDHWTSLFSRSGDQGNSWHGADIDLSSFAGKAVTIRITGTTGSSYTSDMALDAFSISESAPAPEMDMRGNGNYIEQGDTTPTMTDYTDFGKTSVNNGVVSRMFTIGNTGSLPLTLTGQPRVQITGPEAADFTVILEPPPAVASGGTTVFAVQFDPSEIGVRSATVSIPNDDADENPFVFSIQGTGTVFPWNLFMPAMTSGSR